MAAWQASLPSPGWSATKRSGFAWPSPRRLGSDLLDFRLVAGQTRSVQVAARRGQAKKGLPAQTRTWEKVAQLAGQQVGQRAHLAHLACQPLA